jgi:hypothetical protein
MLGSESRLLARRYSASNCGKRAGGPPPAILKRGTEMFLLRTIFWLVVLVLLLPTNEQQQSQVYGTAQAAVKDVSGFCERNPTVCATGKDAFDVFVHKARFGAEMLMSFVKGRTGFGGGDAETAADPSAADTAADPTASEAPGDFENAAPAEDFGKQSSLDQAGIDSWSTAPVTVEPASVESVTSQNTLSPDDLLPAWGGSDTPGT